MRCGALLQELNQKLRSLHLRDDALEERLATLEAELKAERATSARLRSALEAAGGGDAAATSGSGGAELRAPALLGAECHRGARFSAAVIGVPADSPAIELGLLAARITPENFVGLRAVPELPPQPASQSNSNAGAGASAHARDFASSSLGKALHRRLPSGELDLFSGGRGGAQSVASASGGIDLSQGVPPGAAAFEIMWKDMLDGSTSAATPTLQRATIVANAVLGAAVRARVNAWSEEALDRLTGSIGGADALGAGLGAGGSSSAAAAAAVSSQQPGSAAGADADEWVDVADSSGGRQSQPLARADAVAADGRSPVDPPDEVCGVHADKNGTAHERPGSLEQPPPRQIERANSLLGSTARPLVADPGLPAPKGVESSVILSKSHAAALRAALPPVLRLCEGWTLLYSTKQHGISLQTLLRRNTDSGVGCGNNTGKGAALTVVRDAGGAAFGCFTSERWRTNQQRYYGDGQSFVFTLLPHPVAHFWTRRNNYFQLADAESVACGGGGGWALWLDGELSHGNSGYCDTFGNGCLASAESFEIAHVEVYGFDDSLC